MLVAAATHVPLRGDRSRCDDDVVVRVRIGTSGYNYPEWKGSFYPQTLPVAKMLAYYAERFSTVEVNYTFRRMPTAKVLAAWAYNVAMLPAILPRDPKPAEPGIFDTPEFQQRRDKKPQSEDPKQAKDKIREAAAAR